MSQSSERQLSAEDSHLIQVHQLGHPLKVSTIPQNYIRLLQKMGLACCFAGVIALVLLLIGLVANPHLNYIIPPLLGGLSGIMVGGLILLILVPQEQSAHVIICERGLLQMRRHLRGPCVEVVFWDHNAPIRNEFTGQDYFIHDERGKKIALSSQYQDIEEMVTLIMRLSAGESA